MKPLFILLLLSICICNIKFVTGQTSDIYTNEKYNLNAPCTSFGNRNECLSYSYQSCAWSNECFRCDLYNPCTVKFSNYANCSEIVTGPSQPSCNYYENSILLGGLTLMLLVLLVGMICFVVFFVNIRKNYPYNDDLNLPDSNFPEKTTRIIGFSCGIFLCFGFLFLLIASIYWIMFDTTGDVMYFNVSSSIYYGFVSFSFLISTSVLLLLFFCAVIGFLIGIGVSCATDVVNRFANLCHGCICCKDIWLRLKLYTVMVAKKVAKCFGKPEPVITFDDDSML